jgi:hypothetical protein
MSVQVVQTYMNSCGVEWTGVDYIWGCENEVWRGEGEAVTFCQGYVTWKLTSVEDGLAQEVSFHHRPRTHPTPPATTQTMTQ